MCCSSEKASLFVSIEGSSIEHHNITSQKHTLESEVWTVARHLLSKLHQNELISTPLRRHTGTLCMESQLQIGSILESLEQTNKQSWTLFAHVIVKYFEFRTPSD